jgi:plasmid stabilization system protein ParE
MPPVIWSPRSVECIGRLYDFLAEKNVDAANAAAALILKQAELLELFPCVGKPAQDLNPEHREIVIPFGGTGYVLLYHVDGDSPAVTVLAVRHQREAGYGGAD